MLCVRAMISRPERWGADPRAPWSLNWRLQISPPISPRLIKALGKTADSRKYSGCLVAAFWFRRNSVSRLAGKAYDALIKSLSATDEIRSLRLFPTVVAAGDLGDQLRRKRVITSPGNNAAAGSPVGTSSRVPVVLDPTGSLRQTLARAATSFWIERAQSAANPADAPSRNRKLPFKADVKGELASSQQALQWSQIPQQPGTPVAGAENEFTA